MKFTTLKVVNHHDEVEKALTISQIKEMLEYVAETKHEVYKSYESSMKDLDERSDVYDVYKRMVEVYRSERHALRQLAVCLDDYIA